MLLSEAHETKLGPLTMKTVFGTGWHPDDWQEHCNSLLRMHYTWDYQTVPDKDKGDLGMEGFSRDGCAYQCYAAESGLTTAMLYERQRDKMTVDLAKLISNDASICAMLGDIQIRRWVFLVPDFDSRELIRHSTNKAKELRERRPQCIASDDFAVVVATDDFFAMEREQLFRSGPYTLGVPVPVLTVEEIQEWEGTQSALLQNLADKLKKIPTLRAPNDREKFRKEIVLHYLEGQAFEAHLSDAYTQLWLRLNALKSSKGRTLVAASLVSGLAPHDQLTHLVSSLESELRVAFPHLVTQAGPIAWGIVATWLLECSVDFPEAVNA